MKAVLLAGGFGTRLRPLTLNTPKPIVPIFDRPFLYQQIERLRRFGGGGQPFDFNSWSSSFAAGGGLAQPRCRGSDLRPCGDLDARDEHLR